MIKILVCSLLKGAFIILSWCFLFSFLGQTFPLNGCANMFVKPLIWTDHFKCLDNITTLINVVSFLFLAVMRSGYIEPGSRGHMRAGPNVPSPAVTKHSS